MQAVERTAEAIGGSIAAHEPVEIQRAVQLDLPIVKANQFPFCMCKWTGPGYQ